MVSAHMAGAERTSEDPLASFHFGLEVQGHITGFFTEVSGLGSETEIIEHKAMLESGIGEVIKKIPGRLKWENITLKRGITSNLDVWNWRKMVEDGDVVGARADGTITMYDQLGAPVAQWNFEKAWPSKVSGPSLKADGNEIGVEEMTLVHEFIYRAK